MALPSPPTSEQHDKIKNELRVVPGFRYFADHLLDGPYRIVAVEKTNHPDFQAKAILDTIAPVNAPALSYWDGTKVTFLDLYLLPDLLADIVTWHGHEDHLEIDTESNSESWPCWPTEEDWADYLAWLISPEDETSDEVASLTASITTLGVSSYLALAAQVPKHVLDDKDAFHAVLAAATTT